MYKGLLYRRRTLEIEISGAFSFSLILFSLLIDSAFNYIRSRNIKIDAVSGRH